MSSRKDDLHYNKVLFNLIRRVSGSYGVLAKRDSLRSLDDSDGCRGSPVSYVTLTTLLILKGKTYLKTTESQHTVYIFLETGLHPFRLPEEATEGT